MFQPYDLEKSKMTEKAKRHIMIKILEQKKMLFIDTGMKKNIMSIVLDKDASDELNDRLAEDIQRSIYKYYVKTGKYFDNDDLV